VVPYEGQRKRENTIMNRKVFVDQHPDEDETYKQKNMVMMPK
jgi:hypothetical protein